MPEAVTFGLSRDLICDPMLCGAGLSTLRGYTAPFDLVWVLASVEVQIICGAHKPVKVIWLDVNNVIACRRRLGCVSVSDCIIRSFVES